MSVRARQFIFLGILITALILAAACAVPAATHPERPSRTTATAGRVPSPGGSGGGTAPGVMQNSSSPVPGPAAPLLGRPTDQSVNVNVLPSEDLDIFLQYRASTGSALLKTQPVTAKAGVPEDIVLSGLAPDTAYTYAVCWRRNNDALENCSPGYSFHTQRSPGSPFTFDVQADSHLDERASGDLYLRTLASVLADRPDFLIDLGDTSMTEKLPEKTPGAIRNRYLMQRGSLGTVGHSVPIFLALGNHDGEAGYALNGKDRDLALRSLQFRKMYFPNPEPDGFYTGNSATEADTGTRQDYYAWQWGDALFIVLDPYWYTTTKPGGKTDGWGWTLGRTQYNWLRDTLEASRAPYTFVFAHHLVGGDPQGRGGTEFASLYEWGGKNADGSEGFSQHRPGWGEPIHQMLVRHNVTAFFHGHDHLFARQELDGVVYQGVPQPATVGSPRPGAEYGYVNGVVLPGPGHLRITVSPESAWVDYVGSAGAGTPGSAPGNGEVVHSYTLLPHTGGG